MSTEFTPIFLFLLVAIAIALSMMIASAVLGPQQASPRSSRCPMSRA